MSDLIKLVNLTSKWAEDRNLIKGSTAKDQTLKLIQEVGELSDSICKGKNPVDDIGDCLVVLNNLALQHGLTLSECLEHAYNDIKDRKGIMKDGIFIKENDLSLEELLSSSCNFKENIKTVL
jgi:NTP pyrophosphatase (non-canonical NTP hydrolase)